MAKVSLTLEDMRTNPWNASPRDPEFRVVKATNTTKFKIRQLLYMADVDALIAEGVTVTIVEERGE